MRAAVLHVSTAHRVPAQGAAAPLAPAQGAAGLLRLASEGGGGAGLVPAQSLAPGPLLTHLGPGPQPGQQ